MVERVEYQGEEMAIIIRNDYSEEGIHFLTSYDYSQQLAYMASSCRSSNHSALPQSCPTDSSLYAGSIGNP